MTDPAAAWLRYQVAAGETALELRYAGHTWPAIADELHLGTGSDAMRAAALFLSTDLASRRTHGEAAGAAQGGAATSGRAEGAAHASAGG